MRPRVGLCAGCVHVRVVESARGSTFYLCTAPELPKYPPLPVLRCAKHAEMRAATTNAAAGAPVSQDAK